jgi:hypothetical protein
VKKTNTIVSLHLSTGNNRRIWSFGTAGFPFSPGLVHGLSHKGRQRLFEMATSGSLQTSKNLSILLFHLSFCFFLHFLLSCFFFLSIVSQDMAASMPVFWTDAMKQEIQNGMCMRIFFKMYAHTDVSTVWLALLKLHHTQIK